ncbi:hypothetical protein JCM10213_004891 [Rhodosporidiobolus nylandii]
MATPPPLLPQPGSPPDNWRWAPPALPVSVETLPPLPEIADPALALRARTAKNWLTDRKPAEGEVVASESYHRLEYLGDAVLRERVSVWLFENMPEQDSGEWSTIRNNLADNTTQAYLSYAYRLSDRLLAMPQGDRLWEGLRVNSDLLTAQIGALVKEGRRDEVGEWVDGMMQSLKGEMKKLVERLRNRTDYRSQVGRKEHERKAGEARAAFFEGTEGGEGGESEEAPARLWLIYRTHRPSATLHCLKPSRPRPPPAASATRSPVVVAHAATASTAM